MFRYQTFRVLILLLFIFLIAGLFQVQVVKGPSYFRQSEHNRIRLIPLIAPRGNICDRNGVILASNKASYNVSVLPGDLETEDIPRLSKILDISESEIKDRLKKARRVPFMPLVLKRGVDVKTLFMLEEMKPDLGGVLIQVESVRNYPFGEKAAHLLGYVGKVTKKELDADDEERFQNEDLIGRAGIEKGLDAVLRGENGGLQVEVDSRGRQTQVLSERKTRKGEDVTLSIDMRLQSRVEDIFADHKGTIGIMDLETGELLVWVSHPSFDPNIFIDPNKGEERLALLKSPDHPMIDRGLRATYPPGSVFKIVTALTALELNKVNTHTTFFCRGFFRLNPGSRPFRCWFKSGHQDVNIYKALERSCDVFFYNVGRMLEPNQIAAMSRRLGMGEPQDVEVPYVTGTIPDEDWKMKRFKDRWYQGETINYVIGQGYLAVTPLEILRMVGTVAVETEMPSPHFVKSGKVARKKVVFNHEDVKIVKEGLYRVVQSEYGTGQYARVPFMKIAGKTGTAQATRGDDHGWFAGFFPFDKPKYAFVVFAEHGHSGGATCGKLMHEVLLAWKEIMGAKKENSVENEKKEILSTPPVQTMQQIQGAVTTPHVSQ